MGDLEMTWRKEPPEQAVEETRKLWGGYETMTLPEWQSLLERVGLEDVRVVDFSETLVSMEEEMKRELGFWGELKLAAKLAFRRDLTEAMLTYRRLFQDYFDYIGYGYFVGCKPARQ